ncbi:MAG: hypothetical protein ABI651_20560 [Verrucomicrobiota bacterium]
MSMPQIQARFPNYSVNATLTLAWIANFVALVITADAQGTKLADKPAFLASLPGRGLAQHDFLFAGEAKTRDIYIVPGGQVVWSLGEPMVAKDRSRHRAGAGATGEFFLETSLP